MNQPHTHSILSSLIHKLHALHNHSFLSFRLSLAYHSSPTMVSRLTSITTLPLNHVFHHHCFIAHHTRYIHTSPLSFHQPPLPLLFSKSLSFCFFLSLPFSFLCCFGQLFCFFETSLFCLFLQAVLILHFYRHWYKLICFFCCWNIPCRFIVLLFISVQFTFARKGHIFNKYLTIFFSVYAF